MQKNNNCITDQKKEWAQNFYIVHSQFMLFLLDNTRCVKRQSFVQ